MFALTVTFFVAGCSANPLAEDPRLSDTTRILGKRVDVTVTTDGGSELVIRKSIRLKRGMTALDALREVADVRVGPGGVISQVNGVGGGSLKQFGPEKAGWFYRVNGVEADKAPERFRLKSGNSLWWDLRRYDIYERIPVAVGVFPDPLLTGFRESDWPLRIVWGDKFERDAEIFTDQYFQKIDPEIVPLRDTGGIGGVGGGADDEIPVEAVRRKWMTLVIARWEDARLDPYLIDIGLDPRGYGVTAWVEGTQIRYQGPMDEFSRRLDTAEGLVWATTIDGEPDSEPVIVITGTTDEGVRAAARTLLRAGMQFHISGVVDREGNLLAG